MEITHRITRQLSSIYPGSEAKALARWIMEDVFQFTVADLLLDKDNELSADDLYKLQNIIERLLKKEPIQYILGHTCFCGHRFRVAPGVLIPRPETEELVGWASQTVRHETSCNPTILDIGTGSGCIAISMALSHPHAQVTAWDISSDALAIACENARCLHADVQFELHDILEQSEHPSRWDIIISNPPYICQSEAAGMDSNVLDYEPHQALFVPDDAPLLFYQAIAHYASKSLKPGGKLFFEINREYGDETCKILDISGFKNIELKKDQFNNNRMIRAEWKSE